MLEMRIAELEASLTDMRQKYVAVCEERDALQRSSEDVEFREMLFNRTRAAAEEKFSALNTTLMTELEGHKRHIAAAGGEGGLAADFTEPRMHAVRSMVKRELSMPADLQAAVLSLRQQTAVLANDKKELHRKVAALTLQLRKVTGELQADHFAEVDRLRARIAQLESEAERDHKVRGVLRGARQWRASLGDMREDLFSMRHALQQFRGFAFGGGGGGHAAQSRAANDARQGADVFDVASAGVVGVVGRAFEGMAALQQQSDHNGVALREAFETLSRAVVNRCQSVTDSLAGEDGGGQSPRRTPSNSHATLVLGAASPLGSTRGLSSADIGAGSASNNSVAGRLSSPAKKGAKRSAGGSGRGGTKPRPRTSSVAYNPNFSVFSADTRASLADTMLSPSVPVAQQADGCVSLVLGFCDGLEERIRVLEAALRQSKLEAQRCAEEAAAAALAVQSECTLQQSPPSSPGKRSGGQRKSVASSSLIGGTTSPLRRGTAASGRSDPGGTSPTASSLRSSSVSNTKGGGGALRVALLASPSRRTTADFGGRSPSSGPSLGVGRVLPRRQGESVVSLHTPTAQFTPMADGPETLDVGVQTDGDCYLVPLGDGGVRVGAVKAGVGPSSPAGGAASDAMRRQSSATMVSSFSAQTRIVGSKGLVGGSGWGRVTDGDGDSTVSGRLSVVEVNFPQAPRQSATNIVGQVLLSPSAMRPVAARKCAASRDGDGPLKGIDGDDGVEGGERCETPPLPESPTRVLGLGLGNPRAREEALERKGVVIGDWRVARKCFGQWRRRFASHCAGKSPSPAPLAATSVERASTIQRHRQEAAASVGISVSMHLASYGACGVRAVPSPPAPHHGGVGAAGVVISTPLQTVAEVLQSRAQQVSRPMSAPVRRAASTAGLVPSPSSPGRGAGGLRGGAVMGGPIAPSGRAAWEPEPRAVPDATLLQHFRSSAQRLAR